MSLERWHLLSWASSALPPRFSQLVFENQLSALFPWNASFALQGQVVPAAPPPCALGPLVFAISVFTGSDALLLIAASTSCLWALRELLFSHWVVSNSLWPHGLQHARLPRSSLSPRACLNLCPLSGNAIQPSHLMPPPSLPALNLSQHQVLFQWVGSSHQVTKILEPETCVFISPSLSIGLRCGHIFV